jgi:RNase P/RNase MRP subunit p30
VFKIFLSLDAWHTSSTFGLVKFWKNVGMENMNAKKSASGLAKAVLE